MCRNLTGRRLADVREEERLKKWISKKVEREKAKVQKKYAIIFIIIILK
jgi:hypothetical protein